MKSLRDELRKWKADKVKVDKQKKPRKGRKQEKLTNRDIKELMSAPRYGRHRGAIRQK